MFRPGACHLDQFGHDKNGADENALANHPHDERATAQEVEQLVKAVRRLFHGPKGRNQHSASTHERGPTKGPSCEGFSQDQCRADGIEDQSRLDIVSRAMTRAARVEPYRL